jgi:hypothetical protein
MNRPLLATTIAFVVLSATARADPGQSAASQIVDNLARSDVRAVASSLHYPPTYTAEEREADIASVSKSLRFLLDRFGAPKNLRTTAERHVFFHVGTSGGDVPYWESISPYPNRVVVFQTDFANLGPGFVMVELISLDGGAPRVIKGVEFGLPAETPGSKQQILHQFEAMLTHMGVALPPDFQAIAAQQIQPFVTPPASAGP